MPETPPFMSNNFSQEQLRARMRRPEPAANPSPLWSILWVLLFLLFFGGLGAWGYRELVLKYRLPQTRVLHGSKGRTYNARLEGRDDNILKYTLLDDNTVRYVLLSQLTLADQEHIRKLPDELKVTLPLDYLWPDEKGNAQRVRLDERNDDWVKYTELADNATYYAPIAALPAEDQEWVRALPANLDLRYPVEYRFKGENPPLWVQWLGHSDAVVKYQTMQDSVVHYDLISNLPAREQAFVRQLPLRLTFDYPLAREVRSKTGEVLATHINGRTDQFVKAGLESDRVDRYLEINDLAEPDQRFVRALPPNLNLYFPFEATVVMADGKSQAMRFDGRTPSLVRAATTQNSASDLYPLTAFSAEDQKILLMLPARLSLRFPFDYAIEDGSGRRFQARIAGRSETAVQFTLADGKTYAIALAKLSPQSRGVLESFPANLNQIDAVAPVGGGLATVRADQSGTLRTLREQVVTQLAVMSPLVTRLNVRGITTAERTTLETQLSLPRKEMERAYKELDKVKGADRQPGEPQDVTRMRARIATLYKENENYEQQSQNTKLMPFQLRTLESNINRNLQEEETLIRRIISAVGQEKL